MSFLIARLLETHTRCHEQDLNPKPWSLQIELRAKRPFALAHKSVSLQCMLVIGEKIHTIKQYFGCCFVVIVVLISQK